MKKWMIAALGLVTTSVFGAETRYWACSPNSSADSPRILIVKSAAEKGKALFWLEQDLSRKEGKLPAGQYEGLLVPSASGFSTFAKLDVEKYFPNKFPKGSASWLSIPLNLKSTLFAAEVYVLWEQSNGDTQGLIVGNYSCRAK